MNELMYGRMKEKIFGDISHMKVEADDTGDA